MAYRSQRLQSGELRLRRFYGAAVRSGRTLPWSRKVENKGDLDVDFGVYPEELSYDLKTESGAASDRVPKRTMRPSESGSESFGGPALERRSAGDGSRSCVELSAKNPSLPRQAPGSEFFCVLSGVRSSPDSVSVSSADCSALFCLRCRLDSCFFWRSSSLLRFWLLYGFRAICGLPGAFSIAVCFCGTVRALRLPSGCVRRLLCRRERGWRIALPRLKTFPRTRSLSTCRCSDPR